MSLHQKPKAEERSAKRQKRNDEESSSAIGAASAANLSTLGDPLGVILSFLGYEELWKLEQANRHFRGLCQAQWTRLEEKIPAASLEALARDGPTSPFSTLRKIRVSKFYRLSKFAKEMERQSALHRSEGFQCDGCTEYPDLCTNCLAAPNNYDWFLRLSLSEEGTTTEEIVWEGFLCPSAHPPDYDVEFDRDLVAKVTEALLSKWPNLGLEPAEDNSNKILFTLVALNGTNPSTKPALVISTCSKQSQSAVDDEGRLVGDGDVSFWEHEKVQPHKAPRLLEITSSVCLYFRITSGESGSQRLRIARSSMRRV